MAGALESTITLEDVFAMVGSKKVPLAPELAGYLALEIAEGADESGGDVDPRSVYIAEEGTVAIVRRRDLGAGDPEGSIRAILGRLLEASGSKTPALTAAARRRSSRSLRALSEELEAALIPVNRAAGRRALARLAREVKRVAMRVGRASGASPAARPLAAAEAPPAPRTAPGFPQQEEAPTARREALPDPDREAAPSTRETVRPAAAPQQGPVSVDLEDIELASAPAAEEVKPVKPASSPPSARPMRPSTSDVDSLLEQFSLSSQRPDQQVARDLKAMAGLDPTPPPPQIAGHHDDPMSSDAGIESLLALSAPVSRPPSRASGPAPVARPSSNPPATPAQAPNSKRLAAARAEAESRAPALERPPTPTPTPTPIPVPAHAPPPARAVASATPPPSPRHRVSQAEIPTGASMRSQVALARISTGEFRRMSKKRGSDVWLVAVLLGLIGIGAVIVWTLKPGFLTGRTAEKVAQEKAAAEAARQQALLAQQAMACKVTLEVTDVPTNAEVLVRQGQAPVDVDRMPVGARLEFVATAEGFAPKRAVVPGGVSWDATGPGGKPRYEVAVQLDKSSGKPKGDNWPPGEPGTEVGGKGPPGTVHIVTTPRGAEVWLLAGLGPDARIENLPCDQDFDVLAAGPTTLRKRIHVPAASFAPGPEAPENGRFAKVSAK